MLAASDRTAGGGGTTACTLRVDHQIEARARRAGRNNKRHRGGKSRRPRDACGLYRRHGGAGSPIWKLGDMNTDHPRPCDGVEHQIEHERIARRAYELYEARRCQSGHADEDWFLAEIDLRRGGGFTEEDRISSESARNEAEQVRRLAEDAREVRDRHRDALETVWQEQERVRNAGELARAAAEEARAVCEEARAVAEAARHAVVDAV